MEYESKMSTELILSAIVVMVSTITLGSLLIAIGSIGPTFADPFSWGYTPWQLHNFCKQYHAEYPWKCSHVS